ncbi:unnamed protein product, partial [Brenthis ino]
MTRKLCQVSTFISSLGIVMALASRGIFVVGAKRTPFCKYGGSLRELPASYAYAATAKDALNSANLDAILIDATIVGNVNFLSQCDGGKTPRYCGLYSGVPIEKSALGVHKSCGSGLQSVITGAMEILAGSAKTCLTGGTEAMSSLPFLVRDVRFGTSLGKPYYLEDHIRKQFPDSYTGLTLQKMAEIIGERYKINRDMADAYAYKSHLKRKAALENKLLKDKLTSLTVTLKKKDVIIENDELPEVPSIDEFNSAPLLLSDGKIVTSLNSSVPVDGAAALVLANEGIVKCKNLQPLARVSGWACVGVDPLDTGLAATPAVMKLLQTVNLNIDDIDIFEINETFATNALATIKELKIDENKVNTHGGALALGHPVGATGARMAVHLVHQLNRGVKRAIAASSCGGGQGIAVLFEAV